MAKNIRLLWRPLANSIIFLCFTTRIIILILHDKNHIAELRERHVQVHCPVGL